MSNTPTKQRSKRTGQTRHFREHIEQSLVPLLIEREWQRYAVIDADD